LGGNPSTEFLYNRKLVVGYRRPKNLRNHLVKALIPYKAGDGKADPNSVPEANPPTEEGEPKEATRELRDREAPAVKLVKQRSILDFLKPKVGEPGGVGGVSRDMEGTVSDEAHPSQSKCQRKGTDPSKRGFNFCNTSRCRYCPKLNKTGSIVSRTTGATYGCMKNISCRSSNLIYCASCLRCGMQYVGQTSLRVKDRFVHHFLDIGKADKLKSLGRHFSLKDHNGVYDLEISVLEFIKKPPKSPAATIIRNRIERRWIHLLRTLAPQGLNMED
jgi:hypothetical protein